MGETCDIAIIGTGAAGLFAAIWAGRTASAPHRSPLTIIALDGSAKLGIKILVAGGGRCNVTHHAVDASAFAGSTPAGIKKVLRRFDVPATVAFFQSLGVELKCEETGKLFPTTDDAHTVLDALLAEARRVGVELHHPWRVERITREGEGTSAQFTIHRAGAAGHRASAPGEATSTASEAGNTSTLRARRVILATGGMALPRSGSDGHGYAIARSLGHTTTPRVIPALVPLLLPQGFFLCSLSGLAVPATLDVRAGTGKRLATFTNSTLCTHFGLSGPSVLDVSRFYTTAKASDPATNLFINFLPAHTPESLDSFLVSHSSRSPLRILTDRPNSLPDRLARALCEHARIAPTEPMTSLPREARRALVAACTHLGLPITGDRGFTHAEVTAGGIPLSECRLETMESRACPGLFLCGEILDVDGRIGGFNFQWAWASGFVAGTAAAAAPST
ncbi:MAG: NAD(P)/FAD-dependent oxidoreductase [Phycisphaerales bacterium]